MEIVFPGDYFSEDQFLCEFIFTVARYVMFISMITAGKEQIFAKLPTMHLPNQYNLRLFVIQSVKKQNYYV